MSTKTTFVALVTVVWSAVACNTDDGPLPAAAGGGGASPPPAGGSNTGGTTTAGADTAGSIDVQAGGYVKAAPWQGYAWTAASATGSTITPPNYTDLVAATNLCAHGSVAAMSDYSGTGMIGVNINQAQDGTDPPIGTWTPTSIASGGITVNVHNTGGSTIRVQIQAPGGDTDGTKRWCAPVTTFDQALTIPWSDFSTTCWNDQGTVYAGEALESVIIIVPGGNQAAVAFDFCLNTLSLAQ
jgi:hypothetical protein